MHQSLKWMFRIAAVALLMILAVPAAVGAQDEGGESDESEDFLDVSQFDGVEFAISRGWGPATITQEAAPGQLLSLGTMILLFGSDNEAADALQPVSDALTDGYAESGIPLVESDIADDERPGDETIQFEFDPDATAADQLDEADLELLDDLTVLLVRADDTIVIVFALPLDGDAGATALAMAESVIEREAGDDSATFDADGTSTGGLFDRLPDADDPILTNAGVQPVSDIILYPVVD